MRGNKKHKKNQSNLLLFTHTLGIFLKICKSPAPIDLLSLALVRKTIYNDLCCGESKTIQEIWH